MTIWLYCKQDNLAINYPTITASNLVAFFKAYPTSTPAKKPAPGVAAVGQNSTKLIILNAAP